MANNPPQPRFIRRRVAPKPKSLLTRWHLLTFGSEVTHQCVIIFSVSFQYTGLCEAFAPLGSGSPGWSLSGVQVWVSLAFLVVSQERLRLFQVPRPGKSIQRCQDEWISRTNCASSFYRHSPCFSSALPWPQTWFATCLYRSIGSSSLPVPTCGYSMFGIRVSFWSFVSLNVSFWFFTFIIIFFEIWKWTEKIDHLFCLQSTRDNWLYHRSHDNALTFPLHFTHEKLLSFLPRASH